MPKGQGLNSLIPSKNQDSTEKNQQKDTETDRNPQRPNQIDIEETEDETSEPLESENLETQTEEIKNKEELKETPPPKNGEESVFQIEVDKINPNPYQPRKKYDEQSLEELAESIREVGIIQPLVVSKKEKETDRGTEVEYQLISGERRWRAAQKVGLDRVPVIIKDVGLDTDKLSVALIENIQRSNLSPIERARGYARLQDEFNLTQREIATKVGKSRSSISNSLRLLNLPSKMQEALDNGDINESQARLLLSADDPNQQEEVFKGLMEGKLDTKEAKKMVRRSKKSSSSKRKVKSSKSKKGKKRKFWENKLEEKLSAPVQIKRKGDGGKLIIKFFSQDEWNGIVEKIIGSE